MAALQLAARPAEVPQSYFDFHKFCITGEASELCQFDFLRQLPRGDTGFWMLTKRSRVLFLLKRTETDGDDIRSWHFVSHGWTPSGVTVGVTIYND